MKLWFTSRFTAGITVAVAAMSFLQKSRMAGESRKCFKRRFAKRLLRMAVEEVYTEGCYEEFVSQSSCS